MSRVIKYALIALPWVLLMVVVWHPWTRFDLFGFEAASQANFRAYSSFIADLAYQGCVPHEAVVTAIEARDWPFQELSETNHCYAPSGLSDWINVEISPPVPFTPVGSEGTLLGFDTNGCLTAWHTAIGEGSSCPQL